MATVIAKAVRAFLSIRATDDPTGQLLGRP
jgi:hypothetical protein